ncbi:MAG: flagellar hook-associated protein FlgK [Rhodobacteraceae bacterium]|nr:flagellar hook-associated protein FlgK [Paracoccaceae bacterium]
MSITGALSNALSGLNAVSRAAEVTSANLANALTEGYGARSLSLSSQTVSGSGGVKVNGISRDVDQALLAQRREAAAQNAGSESRTAHLEALEGLIGTPDESASLAGRIAEFEATLITAASQPESTLRLEQVARAAGDVTQSFKDISSGIQEMRGEADSTINSMVERMNDLLTEVENLNVSIISAKSRGQSTAGYEDARQQMIDEISVMVPVRQMPRDHGAVALVSEGGAILLDGSAQELVFEPTRFVGVYQDMENGALSGITLGNGQEVWSSARQMLSGGALAAEFAIRDESTANAQAQLDGLARDLVERFQDSGVDPTLASGAPGLFTDAGAAFDASDETGLAARISLNALIDPDAGGEVWRLRDGLGAASVGTTGDGTLLQSLGAALAANLVPSSAALSGRGGSLHDLATQVVSAVSADRLASEQTLSFHVGQLEELQAQELANGVDSDRELQNLLLIEQSYAANARVIETIDEMMTTLMRL